MLKLTVPAVAESTYVEIEVQKGTLFSVYKGRFADVQLEAWLNGNRGFVMVLHDAWWPMTDTDPKTHAEIRSTLAVGLTEGDYELGMGCVFIDAADVKIVVPFRGPFPERELAAVDGASASPANIDRPL